MTFKNYLDKTCIFQTSIAVEVFYNDKNVNSNPRNKNGYFRFLYFEKEMSNLAIYLVKADLMKEKNIRYGYKYCEGKEDIKDEIFKLKVAFQYIDAKSKLIVGLIKESKEENK
jgi:hypothetical protein